MPSLELEALPPCFTVKMYVILSFVSARIAWGRVSPLFISFLIAALRARVESCGVTGGAVIVALRPVVVTAGAGRPPEPGEMMTGVAVAVGVGVGVGVGVASRMPR
jgi:hypothetical protein